MQLIFIKQHRPHFREKYLKCLKNEVGSKTDNKTTMVFSYNAAINGRFEKKLKSFINALPFVYFSVLVSIDGIHNDALQFEQGKQDAKSIKHAILINDKINNTSISN